MERSCGWPFYSFVLDDDECGPPLLSMTFDALFILTVHHGGEADKAQPS